MIIKHTIWTKSLHNHNNNNPASLCDRHNDPHIFVHTVFCAAFYDFWFSTSCWVSKIRLHNEEGKSCCDPMRKSRKVYAESKLNQKTKKKQKNIGHMKFTRLGSNPKYVVQHCFIMRINSWTTCESAELNLRSWKEKEKRVKKKRRTNQQSDDKMSPNMIFEWKKNKEIQLRNVGHKHRPNIMINGTFLASVLVSIVIR